LPVSKDTSPCLPQQTHKQQHSQAPIHVQAPFKPNTLEVDQYWQVIRQEAITVVTNDESSPISEEQLDEETLRGITQRPSGAWQAQIYYAGKTRYIGCFENKMTAARVYQMLRAQLKKKKKGKKGRSTNAKTGSHSVTTTMKRSDDVPKQPVLALPPSMAGTLSRSSSTSSLPPLKKRRIQEKKEGVANEHQNQKPVITSIADDNAYQPPTGPKTQSQVLVAPVVPTAGRANQGQYMFGGAGYVPLLPPNQPNPGMHQYQQQQPMQMMPPPPPQFMGHFASAMTGMFPSHLMNSAAMTPFYAPLMGAYYANSNQSSAPKQAAISSNASARTKFATKACKRVDVSSTSDPVKNAENDKKWKAVRKEVLDHIKTGKVDEAEPVNMDTELLRGITQRPSGKYQAQMYFAGQSRYIGVFESKQKAAVAYEMIRKKIKPPSKSFPKVTLSLSPKCDAPAPGAASGAASGQVAMQHNFPIIANNRAITPSPTTVGGKHGRALPGSTVVMAFPSHMPIAPSGIVSPLSKNTPPSCNNGQAAPIQNGGLCINHYLSPPSQS
jgi:hypothetical protein